MNNWTRLLLTGILGAAIVFGITILISSSSPHLAGKIGAAEVALVNGGFEAPDTEGIANGWTLWYTTALPSLDKPQVSSSTLISPGSSGSASQHMYPQTTSMFDACVFQQITEGITVGHWIYFSAWARVDVGLFTLVTDTQTRIGIDPHGGTDPSSIPYATYPAYWDEFDAGSQEWQHLSVGMRATSPTVTVYACAHPKQQMDLDVYWDDAELVTSPGEFVFLPMADRSYCANPGILWNPDLEKAFGTLTDYQYHDGYSGSVAPYWRPWADTTGSFKHPEFNKTDRNYRKYTGEVAQQYGHSAWGLFKGGIYQVIDCVNPGVTYTFSIYGWGWIGADGNTNDRVSDYTGADGLLMRVGIDPYGGQDFNSSSIIWSDYSSNPYDAWNLYQIEATSQANKISVWVSAQGNKYGMRYHQTFWDNASLQASTP